jgi:hypothetical protein
MLDTRNRASGLLENPLFKEVLFKSGTEIAYCH